MASPSPIGRCFVSLDVRLRDRLLGHMRLTGETIDHFVDRAIDNMLETDHDCTESDDEMAEWGAEPVRIDDTEIKKSCTCTKPRCADYRGRPVEWAPDPAKVRSALDARNGVARKAAADLGVGHTVLDRWLKRMGWR